VSMIVLGLLPSAAAASPSDPTWIAGIYDEADGDDVVALVGETVACRNDDTHILLCLVCLPDELISPTPSAYEPLRTLTRDRGPPQSLAKYTNSRSRSTPLRTSLLIAAPTAITRPRGSSSAYTASGGPPASRTGAFPLLSVRSAPTLLDHYTPRLSHSTSTAPARFDQPRSDRAKGVILLGVGANRCITPNRSNRARSPPS